MTKDHELNITDVMNLLVHEISCRTRSFRHIDANRVMVCISSNKSGAKGGVYGKLIPLRFENGLSRVKHRGSVYTMPEVRRNNIVQLYLLYAYMPKYFDLPAKEKLNVLFHELYHISEYFNGDIRRMGKVNIAHGHSRKHFDRQFETELDTFYEYIRNTPYINFLSMDSSSLFTAFKKITGNRMQIPKPSIVATN